MAGAPIEECNFHVHLHYPKDYVSFLGTQMATFIDPHSCGIVNRVGLYYRTNPLYSLSYAIPTMTVSYPIGESWHFRDLEAATM